MCGFGTLSLVGIDHHFMVILFADILRINFLNTLPATARNSFPASSGFVHRDLQEGYVYLSD